MTGTYAITDFLPAPGSGVPAPGRSGRGGRSDFDLLLEELSGVSQNGGLPSVVAFRPFEYTGGYEADMYGTRNAPGAESHSATSAGAVSADRASAGGNSAGPGGSASGKTAGMDAAGGDTAGTDAAGTTAASENAAGSEQSAKASGKETDAGRDAAGRDAAGKGAAGSKAAGRDIAGSEEAGRSAAGRDTAGSEEAGRSAAGRAAGREAAGTRTVSRGRGAGSAGKAAAGSPGPESTAGAAKNGPTAGEQSSGVPVQRNSVTAAQLSAAQAEEASNSAGSGEGGKIDKVDVSRLIRRALEHRAEGESGAGQKQVDSESGAAFRQARIRHGAHDSKAGESLSELLKSGASRRRAAGEGGDRAAGGGLNDGAGQKVDASKVTLNRDLDLFTGSHGKSSDNGSARFMENRDAAAMLSQTRGAAPQHVEVMQESSRGTFEQIVKQFNLILRKGGGEARLQLQPENLGSIKLNVRLHNSEVSTSILVENQTVKELIMSKLQTLQETLSQQGFEIGSFQVEVREGNDTSYQQGFEQASAPGGEYLTVESAGQEQVSGPAGEYLPWMSTRVNITV